MNKSSMQALQENDFCIQELTLYLDTHPRDEKALRMLNHHLAKRDELKMAVEKHYGPLTNYDNDGSAWHWVRNPWPWDKED